MTTYFSEDHEWINVNGSTGTVGITEYAQNALGDIVFVEVPEVGDELAKGDEVAVVESVKAASDVYAPIGGSIAAVNEGLADDPEKINSDPYGDGWIVRMQPSDSIDEGALMSPDDYQRFIDELDD